MCKLCGLKHKLIAALGERLHMSGAITDQATVNSAFRQVFLGQSWLRVRVVFIQRLRILCSFKKLSSTGRCTTALESQESVSTPGVCMIGYSSLSYKEVQYMVGQTFYLSEVCCPHPKNTVMIAHTCWEHRSSNVWHRKTCCLFSSRPESMFHLLDRFSNSESLYGCYFSK